MISNRHIRCCARTLVVGERRRGDLPRRRGHRARARRHRTRPRIAGSAATTPGMSFPAPGLVHLRARADLDDRSAGLCRRPVRDWIRRPRAWLGNDRYRCQSVSHPIAFLAVYPVLAPAIGALHRARRGRDRCRLSRSGARVAASTAPKPVAALVVSCCRERGFSRGRARARCTDLPHPKRRRPPARAPRRVPKSASQNEKTKPVVHLALGRSRDGFGGTQGTR